jgi:hypothetical protein
MQPWVTHGVNVAASIVPAAIRTTTPRACIALGLLSMVLGMYHQDVKGAAGAELLGATSDTVLVHASIRECP